MFGLPHHGQVPHGHGAVKAAHGPPHGGGVAVISTGAAAGGCPTYPHGSSMVTATRLARAYASAGAVVPTYHCCAPRSGTPASGGRHGGKQNWELGCSCCMDNGRCAHTTHTTYVAMHTDYPQRGVHAEGRLTERLTERHPARGYIEYAVPRGHLNPDYFEMPATGLCVRDFALAIKQPMGVKDGWAVEVQSPNSGRRLRGSQWLPSGSAVQVQVVKVGADALTLSAAAETGVDDGPSVGTSFDATAVPTVSTVSAVPMGPTASGLPPSSAIWAPTDADLLVKVMNRIQRLFGGAHTAHVTVILRPNAACVLGVAVERGSTDKQGPEERFVCALPWPANPSSHHWTATTGAAVGLAVAASLAFKSMRVHTDAVWAGATDGAVAARCRFVSSTNCTIAALRRACVVRMRRACRLVK